MNKSLTDAVEAEAVETGAAQRPPVPPRTTRHRWVPWTGRPTRVDLMLVGALGAMLVFELALRPATPFLIASHAVLLEFLSGDLSAIGAAAAFARVGQVPLWLVVLAGAVGALKVDWLTWWVGRRWGRGVIEMVTPSSRLRYAVLQWRTCSQSRAHFARQAMCRPQTTHTLSVARGAVVRGPPCASHPTMVTRGALSRAPYDVAVCR